MKRTGKAEVDEVGVRRQKKASEQSIRKMKAKGRLLNPVRKNQNRGSQQCKY